MVSENVKIFKTTGNSSPRLSRTIVLNQFRSFHEVLITAMLGHLRFITHRLPLATGYGLAIDIWARDGQCQLAMTLSRWAKERNGADHGNE